MKRLVVFAVVVAAGIVLGAKARERDERAKRWAAATDPHPG
ncbi:MAG TPA: DLW-39 family protein [Propionibacteriaceae bacterium]